MALVGVCGATTWGTTLAMLIANNGHTVQLLARSDDEADALNSDGENRRFAPSVRFPAGLRATPSPDLAFQAADLAIVAVPSQTFRANVQRIAGAIRPPTVVVSATKGLEVGTGKRMSQILREELDPKLSPTVCALSGPNLAREINEGKHSSTVIASESTEAADKAQELINTARFRVYTSNDLIGVECAGALKNVVALGAGVCDGLDLGDNAKAAFLTRGLAEITRLGAAMGANPMTFAGLAGMGDLIATGAGGLSRNHRVGRLLAEGKTLDQIREGMDNIAEGVETTRAALELGRMLNVEMPIAQAAHDVLFGKVPLDEAIRTLMTRAPIREQAL